MWSRAGAAGALLSPAGSASASPPRWTIRNLGTLPAPFNVGSAATAIDEGGTVIGWSAAAGGQQRASVWRNGKLRALPAFGGWTQATAIADDGDIAGSRTSG